MTLPSDKPLAQAHGERGTQVLHPADAHDTPMRYAQLTSGAADQPIGRVETLDGTGTIQHNGVTVAVTKGMPVYHGDLVTAAAQANIGIVFADKSVFSINDGGSMTLDDFVYNPAATNSNSMLFNLVQGSAGFITGQVVKTGDMHVGTPVAVIAVRGTTVIVQCSAEVLAHPSCTFQAATGRFDLLVNGQVLTSVDVRAVKVQDGHFSFELAPKTPEELHNYNSILNTLHNSAASANIELQKEGGVIETHPIHEVQVALAFNDGTTYSSPLDAFAMVATIGDVITTGGLPPLASPTTGEEVAASSLLAITIASTGTTPLLTTGEPPVITSGPQSGSATEIADNAPGENNTLHMQAGTITFTDADTTDTHTANFSAQGSNYLGTFALGTVSETAGSGSLAWTFAVQDSALDFLAAGQQLVQTYSVSMNDGHGGTASQTVTVTLTGTNDAPVTTAGTATTTNATVLNGTVVGFTSDVDNNPATDLTYAVVGAVPTGLTFHADGTWSFDPSGQFDTLAAGQTANVTFDYKANDGLADSNTSTVTITVTGASGSVIAGTSGDDNLTGTGSSDLVLPGDATSAQGDTIHASAGNDTVDFSGAGTGSYHLDYSSLGVDLTANIGATSGTIDKAGMGTDSLTNLDLASGGGGVQLLAGSGNDAFTVNMSSGESLAIQIGTGDDTVTNNGSGFLQIDVSTYQGAYVDALEGIANDAGGTSFLTVSGPVNEWQLSPFADTVFGSNADESFIPGLGNDSIDGRAGFDQVRYDVGGASGIEAVFTAPGTAMVFDTISGEMFTDTLTHIEAIIGTNGTDVLVGAAGNQLLDGRGGNDGLQGGAGDDTLLGGTGTDGLQDGAGANVFNLGADNVSDLVQFTTGALIAGDPSDLLVNFGSATDIVDLSLLFQARSATDLTNYARIHNVGGTTELQIAPAGDGNFSAVIATFDTALSSGTSVNVLYDQNGTQETQGHLIVS